MNYEARVGTEAERAEAEAGAATSVPADADLAQTPLAERRTWLILAAAALAIVAIWFIVHRADIAAPANSTSQAATVTVVVPGRTTVAGAINATGVIAARYDEPVGSVGEGGQVTEIRAEAGQWVRKGQILAVIDRSVQVQAQASQAAQIRVAEADARLAQANLDRGLKLVDRGFISRADIDRLTATRDAAAARVGVARASLGQLQAQAARLTILAPSDGLVLERKIERGQVVGAGTGTLFRIARDGALEVLARLSETDLAAILPGTPAEVTPVGAPRSFAGQVWQVSPVIDPQTRQGTARVALAYAPELRPGGFASLVIRAGTVVAPLLPESAILSDDKGGYVYVVGPDNKVLRRPVKTGTVTNAGIAVVEGLSGTERVVLRAGGFLQPGETVNPRLTPAAR
jgi:HlyD family secretion protein